MMQLDPERVPHHVAIVMDGNGRWAKKRGLPRIVGHQQGVRSVKEIVRAAREFGIKTLTLYAFSTENWRRPALEVQALMALLRKYLQNERRDLEANNVRLQTIGQTEKLPKEVRAVLEEVIAQTAKNTGLILNLALSYGGRSEIARAARLIAEKCRQGEIDSEEISEELFARHLYTAGLPDPDLVIRTGGEHRLSNFLLWQASYSELYITETMWPDFRKTQLLAALIDFAGRERRFGATGEQVRETAEQK